MRILRAGIFPAFAILSLLCVAVLQKKYPQRRLADQITFDFNDGFSTYSAETLRFMSFGYARAASSLLWLRFLQQTPPTNMGRNQVSWIFLDLNAVTELDPEFYPAYEHGGIFLSVITEDKRGAEQILLRGTKIFPERWRIRAYLAYHYQMELDLPEKAGEQYRAAAALPDAPAIVKVLGATFTSRFLGKEAAINMVKELIAKTDDPATRAKLEDKLKRLHRENGGKKNE